MCHLKEKGNAHKLYLTTILENELEQEALLDTGADITLMSFELFKTLQMSSRHSHRDIKLLPCSVDIQLYAPTSTTLNHLAYIQLTIGPMTLAHPEYVLPLNTIPLILGNDLLNQFAPILDFQNWPLPIALPRQEQVHCFVLQAKATQVDSFSPKPDQSVTERSPWSPHELAQHDDFLCAFTNPTGKPEYCPQVVNGIKLADTHVNDAVLALWSDRFAFSKDYMTHCNLTMQIMSLSYHMLVSV